MELTTDSTARIAADILVAYLSNPNTGIGGTMQEKAAAVAEAFTIIHRAVAQAGQTDSGKQP